MTFSDIILFLYIMPAFASQYEIKSYFLNIQVHILSLFLLHTIWNDNYG